MYPKDSQKYDFDITYVPEKEMLLADALSLSVLGGQCTGRIGRERDRECQHDSVPPNIRETNDNQWRDRKDDTCRH